MFGHFLRLGCLSLALRVFVSVFRSGFAIFLRFNMVLVLVGLLCGDLLSFETNTFTFLRSVNFTFFGLTLKFVLRRI